MSKNTHPYANPSDPTNPSVEVPSPKNNTRCLCEAAIFVALAQVLSYLKLYQLPYGGSVTPAMFPILFFSFRWGLKSGLLSAFTFGLLQLIFDGAYAWGWQSMVMDYLFAYTPLGLAGLFHNTELGKKLEMKALYIGTFLGCFGRFIIHYIAGVTLWAEYAPEEFSSAYIYSLVYNGSYMLFSTIIVYILIIALHKPLKPYFLGEDIK